MPIERYLKQEDRNEREDKERWKQYQLTGKAISHGKVANWLEELAVGKEKSRPK